MYIGLTPNLIDLSNLTFISFFLDAQARFSQHYV